jgi:hypothetical protein
MEIEEDRNDGTFWIDPYMTRGREWSTVPLGCSARPMLYVCIYVCMHIHTEKRFMGLGPLKSTSSFRNKRKKKSMVGEVVGGKK